MNYIRKRNEKMRELINHNDGSSYAESYNKMKLLHNYYQGKKCIITTCGPSFNSHKSNIFDLIDDNTILICVKTTYNALKECDFYIPGETTNILNYVNPISFGVENPKRNFNNKTDINFRGFGNRRKTLYDIIKNIDSFSFEKNAMTSPDNMIVHLGHAMHGVALPLAVYLGVKNICVIGWDGHQINKPHHFDNITTNSYDFSEYGCKAIVDCNKVFPKFLKDNYNVDIYQINDESSYTEIPKITYNEFKQL
jgi:hypothetical protein